MLTLDGPPLVDAAVAVSGGLVVDLGPRADVVRRQPTARVRDWPGVLTPGLVNGHAHLEYGPSFADLATSGLPFARWIAQLSGRRAAMSAADWLADARGSVHALLRSGVTAVADVVTVGPGLRAAATAGLRGVSYVEALRADDTSWTEERVRVQALLDGAARSVEATPSLGATHSLGISPHALYTLSGGAFRSAVALARDRGLRLHPHLAETSDEAEWVMSGTGRLAAAVARLGLEHELAGAGTGLSAVAHADALGALGPDVHVAHGVHVDAADRALLRERRTAVALCTRSNAVLQAGEAPVAAYLSEGSPVGLGTDSLASSPGLDLLAEARATRDLAQRQGLSGAEQALVQAATVGGAAAMGLAGVVGVLRVGGLADLAVFDVPTSGDPWAALVDHGASRCVATVLAGRLVHRR